MWLQQTLLAVTVAASCICAAPAWAQYSVFTHDGVIYTNVVVNNVPQTLAEVRTFEARCQTRAAAGQWWMDRSGTIGRVGGPATYNARTCRPVTAVREDMRVRTQVARNGSCTFFGSSGSICRW